ncbi:RND multidrug efflux transporter [Halalkalibacter wakoensis JCM 9140]|uniref:RND multidrug efflux transporter n=1 Tax=Halalkalibacter wakoensis JCM 9140 TaxID=1236970 RepID=W4Q2T4_9BACI|nr:RND multidrug efflux transporter [Halalkalibacter wakoensis JCM 9140]
MKIPKFAVKNPVTTIMMMCLVLILGFVSFTGLRLDLMPNINPPVVAVMTTYPGAGPEEVADVVTKPLEEVVGTSSGLETIQSRSSSNSSLIIAQYEWGTNISEIREDLSSMLGMVQLPDGVETPMLVKFDPTMMPIVQVAVSNGEDIAHLQELVDDTIVPQLQNISGVASVSVTGGFEEEIVVSLNEEALAEYNLTQSQVVQLIQGNNITFPGGVVEEENEKLNLRILASVESIEELENVPVSVTQNGEELDVVTLNEIADVSLAKKDITSMARTNGRDSLLISIQKEASANTVAVSSDVQDRLETIKQDHSEVRFSVASDQGEVIQESINNVLLALVFGAVFAIAVIYAFLRSVKSTVIVGLAIPISVIATFVLMYFTGMSLNIMSLGGLALGVGMLVDNAIVVIENIYRHLTLGKSRKKAAISGAQEVSGAVTASMLTTLSVFLPIVFIGGMVGELFEELALTVVFSLVASWIVALTVVPALASFMLKVVKGKERNGERKESRLYKKVITWALDNRIKTLLITAVAFISSLMLIPQVGTELMPSQDEGIFIIDVEMPEGTTLSSTLEVVEQIENELETVSDVDLVTASIGNGDAMMAAATGSSENTGTITVKLVPASDRSHSTERMMNDFEDQLEGIDRKATVRFSLSSSMEAMMGASNQIEVMLLGDDSEQLEEYSAELTERLSDESDFRSVTNSVQDGKPEYQYMVDKDLAMQHGLTAYQVATFINESLQGIVATTMFDTEVRVQMDGVSNSKEAIEELMMPTQSGQDVALSEIGEIVKGTGPVTVVRDNQQDSIVVTAVFEDVDMGSAASSIQATVDEMIDDLSIDTDEVEIKVAGGAEMMEEAFSSLTLAVVLAIVFVYMVMASNLVHSYNRLLLCLHCHWR